MFVIFFAKNTEKNTLIYSIIKYFIDTLEGFVYICHKIKDKNRFQGSLFS